jgi:hypothetical protein
MNVSILVKIFLLTLLLVHSAVFGQTVHRVEIPIQGQISNIETIPLGNKGVLVISNPDKKTYKIQKLDTNLELVWSLDGPIQSNLEYTTSSYDGQSVYLLFSKYRSTHYQIVKVNIGPGYVENFQVTAVDRFEITDFKTLGYSTFLSGTVRNQPVLLLSQLNTGQTKVLPPASKEPHVIQSIDVDTTFSLVHVTYAVRKARNTQIIAQSFTEDGRFHEEIEATSDENISLLNGKLQVLNDSVKIMIGTYGYRNLQSSHSAISQGIYLSKFVHNKATFTNYHSFSDFEHFFDFLNERQHHKVEKRIEKKKVDGQDLKHHFRLLVHNIIPCDDELLLVAEVFNPEYKNQHQNRMTGYRYRRMSLSPYRVGLYNPYLWNPLYGGTSHHHQLFDGFNYTHAIVANFDHSGKKVWDNSIVFNQIKRMQLKESVRIHRDKAGLTKLFYSQKGAIRSKAIQQNNLVDYDRTLKSTTLIDSDQIKKTERDDVAYWYDDFLLSWGEQLIVNQEEEPVSNRRKVFYLNKITF